jgi:hypothetical protein
MRVLICFCSVFLIAMVAAWTAGELLGLIH